LHSNGYGKVKDVTFISKTAENGVKYNGVIVTLQWYMNDKVRTLFEELLNSENKISKIYHNSSRYWMITEHKGKHVHAVAIDQDPTLNPITEETPKVDNVDLELELQSVKAQLYLLQYKCEMHEKTIEKLKHDKIQDRLHYSEIKHQLQEKEDEYKEKEEECEKYEVMIKEKDALIFLYKYVE
jgi:hypothetical protein